MKTKLLKLMGVALTLVLLASLTVGLAGAPAGAVTSNLKFTKLDLPKVEVWNNESTFAAAEGDFWVTPNTDVGPIAITPEGDVLFAAVYPDDGSFYEVLKSLDGGYSWTVTGFNAASDGSLIVDIVTSPEYGDDTIVCVATQAFVYISDDSGKNFVALANLWGGIITDIDVTVSDDGDLAIMVATTAGDVWVKKGLLAWQAQGLPAVAPPVGAPLAADFLPTFATDGNIGICAICTTPDPDGVGPLTGTTTMAFTFNDINLGGGWGTSGIANAPFTNASGADFGSVFARTAFPDDFDAFGIGNNVCFAGITTVFGATSLPETDGSDAYKVILKQAGTSSAVDLDVRGVITTLLPTATAVTSIDVCGSAEEATILVGTDACNLTDTPTYWFTYHSEDSGENWMFSFKQPTGGDEETPNLEYEDARTQVLMVPDFCVRPTAYAATRDSADDVGSIGTSAFQRTINGADSWNQISCIDYARVTADYWITLYGFSAAGFNASSRLRMITESNGNHGFLWQRTGGKHWEGILSYAVPGVTDNLFQIVTLKDGSALFVVDRNNSCMWRSTDGGVTWPKKINTKDGLVRVTAVSATTLYCAHDSPLANNSGIWWTTKSGTGWTKPDDSEIPNATEVGGIAVMGDIVFCGTYDGTVFISSDGGVTVEKVGKNDPGLPGPGPPTLATNDLNFATNGILYAVVPGATDHGVWRTSVDLDNPGDCTWERIDDNQDSTGAVVYDETTLECGGPAICLPFNGILYVSDEHGVGADTGGLWRCTNPTADLDSITPPYFERENKGLNIGDAMEFRSLDLKPPKLSPTLFYANGTAANYWEQIVMFTDILNAGVPLASPEADATGVGLLPEGYVYPEVFLAWQEMAGATSYQYQVAIDAAFKTKVASDFTTSLATPALKLNPNTTYYWRVRVADQGSLIGAPLISPWSEVRKFKTAIGASMARPALQAPWPGEPDVPLSPTFEWSGIEWAEVYEYEISLDPTTTAGGYFSTPLVALVGTDSLVSTAWKCDTTLDYETRYYWHVKAIGVDTDTPWSDVGTFTTIGVPPEPVEPGGDIVIPPPNVITPAWIWAIVIIGAILVIAVIVLIVTTRRVP
ncbi:MAG: exo-alpha-sialidase [Deltaproteobacteria bacterium]|nr:exo-alpha-sialidase [Deltaproteobacteria bacterium]